MTEASSLDIVIPTGHRRKSLARLLSSIRRQEKPGTWRVVVVADGTSLDAEALRIIEVEPAIELVRISRGGVNRARNAGLRRCRSDWVLMLDDDVVLPEGYLGALLDRIGQETRVVAVGGIYLPKEGAVSAATAYNYIASSWVRSATRLDGTTFALLGGNACYHRRRLGERLRFAEWIHFGGAETELNLRLIEQGLELGFDPALHVYHDCEVGILGLVRKGFAQARGRSSLEGRISSAVLALTDIARVEDQRPGVRAYFLGYDLFNFCRAHNLLRHSDGYELRFHQAIIWGGEQIFRSSGIERIWGLGVSLMRAMLNSLVRLRDWVRWQVPPQCRALVTWVRWQVPPKYRALVIWVRWKTLPIVVIVVISVPCAFLQIPVFLPRERLSDLRTQILRKILG